LVEKARPVAKVEWVWNDSRLPKKWKVKDLNKGFIPENNLDYYSRSRIEFVLLPEYNGRRLSCRIINHPFSTMTVNETTRENSKSMEHIYLDVKFKPRDVRVISSSKGILSCRANSNPENTIDWFLKRPFDKYFRLVQRNNHTINIQKLKDYKDAEIQCRSTNSEGYTEVTHRLEQDLSFSSVEYTSPGILISVNLLYAVLILVCCLAAMLFWLLIRKNGCELLKQNAACRDNCRPSQDYDTFPNQQQGLVTSASFSFKEGSGFAKLQPPQPYTPIQSNRPPYLIQPSKSKKVTYSPSLISSTEIDL
jgi:hypothetical protein